MVKGAEMKWIRCSLTLTKSEADLVDWALGGMEGLGEEDQAEMWGEAREFNSDDILKGNTLDLSSFNEDMIEDLLYRIEEQMPSMAAGEDPLVYARTVKTVNSLSNKIRSLE